MLKISVILKYVIEPTVDIKFRIRSTVKVCCSLFESRTMISVPRKTSVMAVTSYLGLNFSPRYLTEINTFMMTADEELQAIRVRSQKGSAKKCPSEPTTTRKMPQRPLRVQNMFFWIVLSVVSYPDLFRFSSSMWPTF